MDDNEDTIILAIDSYSDPLKYIYREAQRVAQLTRAVGLDEGKENSAKTVREMEARR